MRRSYPGVIPLGKGQYRIRAKVRHPKTGREHEIDRVVQAASATAAATLRASERDAWLKKHGRLAKPGERLRLGPALERWLEGKRLAVRDSTASTYSSQAAWWVRVLGDYWLDELEPLDVREALVGGREGGDHSETLAGRLRLLRTFAREEGFASIVERVQVARNVRELEQHEDEGRGLSLEELRRFLAAGPHACLTKGGEVVSWWHRSWALVSTLAFTGLRFGEASALEWQDVDLEAGAVRVRRAQWRGKLGHVKAKASRRTVPIDAELVELLEAHRRVMLRCQATGVHSALVFPSRRKTGSGYVTNAHARKSILRVTSAAGIDLDGRPAVHCLRHTFNNLVRQASPELVRQAVIGHADEAIGERYSAVSMEEKRAHLAPVHQLMRGTNT